MMVELLQMDAVQMNDSTAASAAQKKAVMRGGVGTVLEKRSLLGMNLMDAPRGFQFFQLTVDGGKAYGVVGAAQFFCQFGSGQSVLGTLRQAVKNRLMLLGCICHKNDLL